MVGRFQPPCSDDAQGAAEERTKPYQHTVTGVPQAATQRIAENLGGVSGSADKQAQVAWRLK